VTSAAAPPVRIGVDIGGTFTDLQIFDARTRAISGLKTLTTPDDPSIGLMTGIRRSAQLNGFALVDVGYLVHGTTIATNAVLERKLAKGALVTTARFEDVVEIGRHYRRQIYSLNPRVPPMLIPRDRRIGIEERIKADGHIETPLTRAAIEQLMRKLDALEVEAVAISLLNSYVNASHEIAIAEAIAKTRPSLKVSCSGTLSPEIREYERTSTTILNALLIPIVSKYLDNLAARMRAEGFAPRLLLVQSNGGVCGVDAAAQEPVRLLLSGPSGGSAACALLGRVLGEANIVGVDMGGTSFDVSVVHEGSVDLIMQGEIDHMPVRLPMVEIRSIGAGGGSIAAVHPGSRLQVGPESAGSHPGPACYGRGGTRPTVTDANVVLGRLDGESFLGGDMRLDSPAARAAISAEIAEPLDLSVEAAAEGVLIVTNSTLGAAIRLSLFEKGFDPREFAMIAFGGAAGLHAVAVAQEIGVKRIVFPENASTLSAYGILHSNLAHDLVRSRVYAARPESLPALKPLVGALISEAHARLEADAVPAGARQITLAADMRYEGQAFELTVPARDSHLDETVLASLIADFHEIHCQRFSYADPGSPVELVSLRVAAIGHLPTPDPKPFEVRGDGKSSKTRKIWLSGALREVAVWKRDQIPLGGTVAGPAVIEEAYTTVLLLEGWDCHRDASGHLSARRA
jgi:N-methylhydantoinase A